MTDKNANTEIRKEFCPNCEKETECEFTAELYGCFNDTGYFNTH